MVMKEMIYFDGGKGVTRIGFDSVSPLISLQCSDPYCVLFVSPPPHHYIAGGIYMVSFRSRQYNRGQKKIWK
jgi:hypothetical protein